jgi:signal transduction histidine kinase
LPGEGRPAAGRTSRGSGLRYGIPLFLDQLVEVLRLEHANAGTISSALPEAPATVIHAAPSPSDIGKTAAQHGDELLRTGFTVDQVVHDYGDLCQAVTEMAMEQRANVTADEFRTLNRCLDEAIADAVTEFGRQRDRLTVDQSTRALNEHVGFLTHELRNLVATAILAVATIKKGRVGLAGATGALLDRSLIGLRDLVDRTLVEVRLTAGIADRRQRIVIADLIAEVQVAAAMEATLLDLEFIVAPTDDGLAVDGDRQILAAALANPLQNAIKFTHPRGRISLVAHAVADRVLIEVQDECGGLPPGKEEAIFLSFEQFGVARSGLGLGLPISRRGVEANGGKLYVLDVPGTGCVFTIDLPRAPTPAA